MESKDDRSIFFLTLSLICIWLILDSMYGRKYIDNFLKTMFPNFYRTTEERKELVIGQQLIDAIKNIFSSIFGGFANMFNFGGNKSDKSENTKDDETTDTSDNEYSFGRIGGVPIIVPNNWDEYMPGAKTEVS